MDLLGEYTALVEGLRSAGVEYATCGGLAMAVHGFIRATKDIDLLIQEQDVEQAFSVARSLGFDEGLPLDFNAGKFKLRRLSKIDSEARELVTIDFLIVTDWMKDVWDERQEVEWESGRAWVVSREGLIKMKTLAGRDQDLVDIRNLTEANDEN
jgi:hypothetical protein